MPDSVNEKGFITLGPVKPLDYTTWIVKDAMPDDVYIYQPMDIQKFLEDKLSFLSTYKIGDAFYSDWLTKQCMEQNLNPKMILVSLQKEQSIISMKSQPPDKIMNRALGFGMTDSGDMPQYYGFDKQNVSAIAWFNRQMSKIAPLYASGKPKTILVDQNMLSLTPLNAMTYVLYLYTPWTGGPDSVFYNKWGSHGVYLFWKLWKQYWTENLQAYLHKDVSV